MPNEDFMAKNKGIRPPNWPDSVYRRKAERARQMVEDVRKTINVMTPEELKKPLTAIEMARLRTLVSKTEVTRDQILEMECLTRRAMFEIDRFREVEKKLTAFLADYRDEPHYPDGAIMGEVTFKDIRTLTKALWP